jgi:hypothetical protein
MVPGTQGGLRDPRARAVPAPAHRPATRTGTGQRALPRRAQGQWRLALPHHRDTRFANDKTPYKNWQGARLYHARNKQVEAPAFYLHLQPGNCFVAAGVWHPHAGNTAPYPSFHHRQSGQLEGSRARHQLSAGGSISMTTRC